MAISDGVVNGDVMREAASVIERMEAADAVAWLREREDTVGVFVSRAASRATADLQEHGGLVLNRLQTNTIQRAVIITGVSAVAAIMSGHYRAWRDLVRCSLLAEFDPLLAVRRRVNTGVQPPPPQKKPGVQGRGGSKNRSESKAEVIEVSRFRFVDCTVAADTDDPNAKLLLLTTATANTAQRRETLDLDDGEKLLKSLVDCLAKLGSPLAAGVWSAVCGADPTFDPPYIDGDDDDEDSGDIEAGT